VTKTRDFTAPGNDSIRDVSMQERTRRVTLVNWCNGHLTLMYQFSCNRAAQNLQRAMNGLKDIKAPEKM
jgi:hypothetical protein